MQCCERKDFDVSKKSIELFQESILKEEKMTEIIEIS